MLMALSARRVLSGVLTVGDAVAINGLLLQLHAPLTSLGYSYQQIRQALTDMVQLLQLLRRTPKVVTSAGAPDLALTRGEVIFENVSFNYANWGADSLPPHLRNVSFSIPAGKKTAIVGPTGSGKSTILKLALRVHDPNSGQIRVDGQDIRHVDLTSLRQQIALVPQARH